MALQKLERKQLQAPNVGLRLLYDEGQVHHSAIMLLQWCVAKPILDLFEERKVADPQLFVTVTNPKGVQKRYLFRLESDQELLEFHTSGVHTIEATIVWSPLPSDIKEVLLRMWQSGGYYYDFKDCYGLGKGGGRIGLKHMCTATITIDVPAAFFAPQLSEFETWWINLWRDTPAVDSCTITRRRVFAYTLQPFLVATWVVLKTLWRFFLACFFTFLVPCRGVDWLPIVHPFQMDFDDVFFDCSSRLWYDSRGNKRAHGEWLTLCTPLIHVVLMLLGLITIRVLGDSFTVLSIVSAYVAVAVAASVFVGLCVMIMFGPGLLDSMRERFGQNTYQRKFDHLLCGVSPEQGLRPTGFSFRLTYQRTKAKLCRPVVRG